MRYARVTDVPSWYAIHTHANQENRTEQNLRAWEVETFFPRIKDCRFNEFTSKPFYLIKPLFPGYLFARFGLNSMLHKVRFTRGVQSIVCIDGNPVVVDDRVIEIISGQIDTMGFVKINESLELGASVLIQAGPFKGLTGIFERETRAADRIRILLDCVSFPACVEIERNVVKRA